MARLRSRPSAKLVAISDSAVGAAIAAPTPCRARAAMSGAVPGASPPSREAKTNRAMPKRNRR
ncbi:hypothetical protein SGLAM104S_09730 [Streptomyces glaucescens]